MQRKISASRHLTALVGLVNDRVYDPLLKQSDRQTWICHVQLAFVIRLAADRSGFLLGPHPLKGLQLSVTSAGMNVWVVRESDALRWLLMCGVCAGDEYPYDVAVDGWRGFIPYQHIGLAFGRGNAQVSVGTKIASEFVRTLVHGQISDRTKKQVYNR